MSRRDAIGAGVRAPGADPMEAIYGEVPSPARSPRLVPPSADEPSEPEAALARLSMRIDCELLERARDLAYWDRLSLVMVVEDALRAVIQRYEASHGPLADRPRSARRLRRRGAR